MEPTFRTRPWGVGDLTGRPVDEVFRLVQLDVPDLVVERLVVTHPTDDDNVYFLGDARGHNRVQVDTAADGQPPFLVEAGDRAVTSVIGEAAGIVRRALESGRVRASDDAM